MKTIDFLRKIAVELIDNLDNRDQFLSSISEKIQIDMKKQGITSDIFDFSGDEARIKLKDFGVHDIFHEKGYLSSLDGENDFFPSIELRDTYQALVDDDKFEKLKEATFESYMKVNSDAGIWDDIANGNLSDYDSHDLFEELCERIGVKADDYFNDNADYDRIDEALSGAFNSEEIIVKIKEISKSRFYDSMDSSRQSNITEIESYLESQLGYDKSSNSVSMNANDFYNETQELLLDREMPNTPEEFNDSASKFLEENYGLDNEILQKEICETISLFNEEQMDWGGISKIGRDLCDPDSNNIPSQVRAAFNYRENHCSGINHVSPENDDFDKLTGLISDQEDDKQWNSDMYNEVANEIWESFKSEMNKGLIFTKSDNQEAFKEKIREKEAENSNGNSNNGDGDCSM
jgi:hypothetical protein